MKLLGLAAIAIASVAHADTTLIGSGSTFQKAYHEVAIDTYAKQTGVAVLYGGGGSGKGRQDLPARHRDVERQGDRGGTPRRAP
jgi:ABC-type phosphate transport system substrate-binding protein